MADESKELVEVAVLIPHADFSGPRVDTEKRCFAGREADKTDGEGKVTKKGKAIKTQNKVKISLPVPATDEEAEKFYNVKLASLVGMGCRQIAYTLNKTDAYLESIGENDVDTAGLTTLIEGDIFKQERAKTASVTRQKAQAYDSLKAKYGVDDGELEAILAHAKEKKAKGKK